MAAIHGSVYLIVGLVVAIYSYFMDKKKFFVFIIIGAIFILVGIAKLIINRAKQPKQDIHRPIHAQKYQQPVQKVEQTIAAYCHKCGSAIRHFDNFCGRCGQRIFRRK